MGLLSLCEDIFKQSDKVLNNIQLKISRDIGCQRLINVRMIMRKLKKWVHEKWIRTVRERLHRTRDNNL